MSRLRRLDVESLARPGAVVDDTDGPLVSGSDGDHEASRDLGHVGLALVLCRSVQELSVDTGEQSSVTCFEFHIGFCIEKKRGIFLKYYSLSALSFI